MANNHNLDHLYIPGGDRVFIGGTFKPNTASDIDNTLNVGTGGWTVAWTSTGVYTITLAVTYARLVHAFAPVIIINNGHDKIAQWKTVPRSAIGSAILRVWDISDAAVANIAADADSWISWGLILANTGVPKP